VVVDTNVYISAFLYPQRPVFQVWRQALLRRYQLITSPAIIREVGHILRRDLAWEDLRVTRRLKLLARISALVTPTVVLDVITADPPDNRILECAVEGKADLIVSGDLHLRRLKAYQGIPVVRPTDFLRTLGIVVKTS